MANTTQPDPRAMRARQVKAAYGIGKKILYTKVREGLLHPVRVTSRCTLYQVAELDAIFCGATAIAAVCDGATK